MRPIRLLLVRVLYSAFVLAAVSVLLFAAVGAAPGDFLSDLRLNPQISDATLARLRERYGLDDPLPVQYARWAASVFRGEFGYSCAKGRRTRCCSQSFRRSWHGYWPFPSAR
jgi:peptide/nickel transport system permease protein